MPTTATRDIIGVVQTYEVTQENIYLSLMFSALEGCDLSLSARQMWKTISISNRNSLPIKNIKFSYLSPTDLITGRASWFVGAGGGGK
jgi:hypothetical protein